MSPQTVNIRPSVSVAALEQGPDQRIRIEVKDSRKDTIIGYRGGVYDTASISTDSRMLDSMYTEIAGAFNTMGFVVIENDPTITNKLVIEIEQLDYRAVQRKLIWGIELYASIKATADTARKTSSVALQDKRTRDYPKFPSIEQNEEMINDMISSLLQRLVDDREFINALKG